MALVSGVSSGDLPVWSGVHAPRVGVGPAHVGASGQRLRHVRLRKDQEHTRVGLSVRYPVVKDVELAILLLAWCNSICIPKAHSTHPRVNYYVAMSRCWNTVNKGRPGMHSG